MQSQNSQENSIIKDQYNQISHKKQNQKATDFEQYLSQKINEKQVQESQIHQKQHNKNGYHNNKSHNSEQNLSYMSQNNHNNNPEFLQNLKNTKIKNEDPFQDFAIQQLNLKKQQKKEQQQQQNIQITFKQATQEELQLKQQQIQQNTEQQNDYSAREIAEIYDKFDSQENNSNILPTNIPPYLFGDPNINLNNCTLEQQESLLASMVFEEGGQNSQDLKKYRQIWSTGPAQQQLSSANMERTNQMKNQLQSIRTTNRSLHSGNSQKLQDQEYLNQILSQNQNQMLMQQKFLLQQQQQQKIQELPSSKRNSFKRCNSGAQKDFDFSQKRHIKRISSSSRQRSVDGQQQQQEQNQNNNNISNSDKKKYFLKNVTKLPPTGINNTNNSTRKNSSQSTSNLDFTNNNNNNKNISIINSNNNNKHNSLLKNSQSNKNFNSQKVSEFEQKQEKQQNLHMGFGGTMPVKKPILQQSNINNLGRPPISNKNKNNSNNNISNFNSINDSINKSSSRQSLHTLNKQQQKLNGGNKYSSVKQLQKQNSSSNLHHNQNQNHNQQQEYAQVFDVVDYVSAIPDWLQKRDDFKDLASQEQFDMQKKVLSIAKIPTFHRTGEEKLLIAQFLQKIALFRLMPLSLLEFIGGKVTTQSFKEEGSKNQDQKNLNRNQINTELQKQQKSVNRSYKNKEYICRKGDVGNCMYIIFRGNVEVVIGGNVVQVFSVKELVGRSALENDAPRNADLRAKGEVDLLLLDRNDYQHCIYSFIKNERDNLEKFVGKIPFFTNNFPQKTLIRMLKEMKIRFLAFKDKLYTKGDPIDGMYIVRSGKLIQNIQVDIKYTNQWPLTQDGRTYWEKRIMNKIVDYTIEYKEGQVLGFSEIVDLDNDGTRKESIIAGEDSIVICVPKSQFNWIFTDQDYPVFREYKKSMTPHTEKELQQIILKDETEVKNKLQIFEQAMKQNLNTCSKGRMASKEKKTFDIIQQTKQKINKSQREKLPATSSKPTNQVADFYFTQD